MEKVAETLDGWKKAYLLFGGRFTLPQTSLSQLPSCFLSIFHIPKPMVKDKKSLKKFLRIRS